MTNQKYYPGERYYQVANVDAQSVREGFLIRLEEFDIIMNDIRNNPMNGSVQHYLLVGRRGSGKSTLLRRIQVEIEEDEQLKNTYIPINLAEEQADIYRLFDLLNAIIEELDENVPVRRPAEDDDCNLYTRNLIASIHYAIEQSGKKVVLLLDNIDRIFENLHEDTSLVREMLLNFSDIKIIGGSTRMTEHFWKYDEPFYQFFRVLELKPLTNEEIKTLLLHWSKKPGMAALKDFVENRPGQLETIRRLTDGLPRTLHFFVNILINNTQETGYEYLKQIMDLVTPQYQERLNNLPPAQRKIVLQMAFIWEAAGTKDIAAITRMSNNIVSAQLKQLTDKWIVEKIETGTKNHLYRLSERFFNLWLLFTQGNPKEKRRAKYLTIFLENFYDGDGLRNIATHHLSLLKEHKLAPNKAIFLTKALAQSRFIDSDMRDSMITHTLELNDLDVEMRTQMPPLISDLKKEIYELTVKKEWAKAKELAENIEQEDGIKEFLLGRIYSFEGNKQKAMHFYKISGEKGNIDAINDLGVLYLGQKNYEQAEKYYLQAIEKGVTEAINNLGYLYSKQKNYEQAEKYYLEAIEKGVTEAINNLGSLYSKQKNYEQAEKYYLMAIEKGDNDALNNLGILYSEQKEYIKAEKYYRQAIEKGNNKGLNNLGGLFLEQKNYEEAKKYYLLAIEKGDNNALFNLGNLYSEQKNYEQGEKYFLQAIENGDNDALNNLANLYSEQKNFEQAEKYYLQAIDKRYNKSLFNLGNLYSEQKNYEQAEKYYLQAIEKGDIDALNNLGLLYSEQKNYEQAEKYYLQAIEKGDIDALNNLGLLYSEQKNYEQAEKYYLQAIENGDNDAFFNLAWLYYERGIKKEKACELINQDFKNNRKPLLSILINAWNGMINEASNDVLQLIKDKNYDDLDIVLEGLLYHYQVNLVYSLFNDPEYGTQLRERFEPLYYAVGVLAGKDNNITLKIPPEIQETVDEIVIRVKEKQEFYYGDKY